MSTSPDVSELKAKLALLRLAEELRSVSAACRIMGCSRGRFYRLRHRFLHSGIAGLGAPARRSFVPVNRFPAWIDTFVIEVSIDHPRWGRRRIVAALASRGVVVSASGVRGVWKRHGLLTMRQRAHAARERRARDSLTVAANGQGRERSSRAAMRSTPASNASSK